MDIGVKKTDQKQQAYEIAKTLTNSFDENGLKNMREDLNNHTLFGAYMEGKMVGFVTYKELNPDTIEISWLAVLHDYQGKGIGSRLVLESLKQVGKSHKACEVKALSEIHPDEGYRRTREFYKKLGFIALETIDPYPGWSKGSPCQIFVKFLGA